MLPEEGLSRRESEVMEILHRRGSATAVEVRGDMADPPTDAAVRSTLRILVEKGHVGFEFDGPRHVYFPAARLEEASRSALKQLVRTFFNGSPGSAIAALLDNKSTQISAEEYRRLSQLLKQAREPQGAEKS